MLRSSNPIPSSAAFVGANRVWPPSGFSNFGNKPVNVRAAHNEVNCSSVQITSAMVGTGSGVGAAVGCFVGLIVGACVGLLVGLLVGFLVGLLVGFLVGWREG